MDLQDLVQCSELSALWDLPIECNNVHEGQQDLAKQGLQPPVKAVGIHHHSEHRLCCLTAETEEEKQILEEMPHWHSSCRKG